MRPFSLTVSLLAALSIVAACGGAPSPSPSAGPSAAPTIAPSGGLVLRATQMQAIPPASRFAWLPVAAVTADLMLVTPGPAIDMYPGPLVPNLTARSLTAAGWAAIVSEADALGLLGDRTDFIPGDAVPGGVLGRIELLDDGRGYELVGDPSRLVRCGGARCIPDPGTPEAFAAFWQRLVDLGAWLGAELGPESAYLPAAYAILVGGTPAEPSPLEPRILEWPLEAGLGTFGTAIGAAPTPRCGTVRDAEADAVRPSLDAANALTQWVDSPSTSATFSLEVRPLLPGEDVCAELFSPS
jgi:hypothetical protein